MQPAHFDSVKIGDKLWLPGRKIMARVSSILMKRPTVRGSIEVNDDRGIATTYTRQGWQAFYATDDEVRFALDIDRVVSPQNVPGMKRIAVPVVVQPKGQAPRKGWHDPLPPAQVRQPRAVDSVPSFCYKDAEQMALSLPLDVPRPLEGVWSL